jgi:hypothetical protein
MTSNQSHDFMAVVWEAAIRAFLVRKLQVELPAGKEIVITAERLQSWTKRLNDSLNAEWQRIASEL